MSFYFGYEIENNITIPFPFKEIVSPRKEHLDFLRQALENHNH
jgi:hypothetical protein